MSSPTPVASMKRSRLLQPAVSSGLPSKKRDLLSRSRRHSLYCARAPSRAKVEIRAHVMPAPALLLTRSPQMCAFVVVQLAYVEEQSHFPLVAWMLAWNPVSAVASSTHFAEEGADARAALNAAARVWASVASAATTVLKVASSQSVVEGGSSVLHLKGAVQAEPAAFERPLRSRLVGIAAMTPTRPEPNVGTAVKGELMASSTSRLVAEELRHASAPRMPTSELIPKSPP
mmetsp:Transcript_17384/g.46048  ORF Transcript_17384/g.46048 Transcript_17384/m.46048 type:complete len:231 (-) Transcript_17384:553-1245(-)